MRLQPLALSSGIGEDLAEERELLVAIDAGVITNFVGLTVVAVTIPVAAASILLTGTSRPIVVSLN